MNPYEPSEVHPPEEPKPLQESKWLNTSSWWLLPLMIGSACSLPVLFIGFADPEPTPKEAESVLPQALMNFAAGAAFGLVLVIYIRFRTRLQR